MLAILRKELVDYFTGIRCLILFILVFGLCALALVAAYQGIRGAGTGGFIFLRLYTTEPTFGGGLSSLLNFVNIVALIFVPLIGIALGFDAINRERAGGTLSRIMSQPVFRDSVINGKFMAGIVILSIMMTTAILLIGGYGLRMVGVPPSLEEINRLFIYLVLIIIYGAFWIGLSILLSILFRSLGTSLICSIALWLIFSFAVLVVATVGTGQSAEALQTIIRFSPNWLFGNASSAILHPTVRTFGTITAEQAAYMIPNPLSLGQSLILIWPNLAGLVSLSVICFAISYVLFMRQEIRAT